MHAIDCLEKVVAWCKKRGLSVVFNRVKTGGVIVDSTIMVNGRQRPELQLFVLLHECGHHLVCSSPPADGRFSKGYAESRQHALRTSVHRVDILDEELEAWHRGKRLAVRLNIQLDERRWDKVRSSFLRSYAKWVLRTEGD